MQGSNDLVPSRQMADRPGEVLIAHNPRAGARGRQQAVETLAKGLRDRQVTCQIVTDLDILTDQANRLAASHELRAVVSAGGDGTLSELANRLPAETPLAILPLGTENLMARYLRLPRQPEAVADLMVSGEVVSLDAGRANGRIFTLMISAGFDAEVVRRLSESRSGHIVRMSYAKPLWTTLRRYKYPQIGIYLDERAGETSTAPDAQARWVFGMNVPMYAFGLNFTPGGWPHDGLFDLCLFQGNHFLSGFKYAAAAFCGQHLRFRDATILKGSRFHLVAQGEYQIPFQLDGDFAGHLPVDVELLRGQLKIVAPPRVAARFATMPTEV